MICFIALGVFAVLGIFSATHRRLAKEALDCVLKKATFRRCTTGLDTKLKSDISGAFLRLNPSTGRFIFKHFQTLSTIFTILMVLSVLGIAWGGYNYYLYGNCNGPNSDGFCVFDPTGSNNDVSAPSEEGICLPTANTPDSLTLEDVDLSVFMSFGGGPNEVVFLGCQACEYTRKAYPEIRGLSEREDVTFYFVPFHVKEGSDHLSPILNCLYSDDPSRVMPFNDLMMETPVEQLVNKSVIESHLASVGADTASVLACAETDEAQELAATQLSEAQKTNIYGTPLVFINDEPVVGPKPGRVYRRLLE